MVLFTLFITVSRIWQDGNKNYHKGRNFGGKKIWWKENLADLNEICQIKFPPKFLFSAIRQIKFRPN